MNDSTRKLLTKMIGECWHLFNLPYEITERCGKCGKVRSEAYNRPFATPDDQHAVMQAIVKAGKWRDFANYALDKYMEDRHWLETIEDSIDATEWLFLNPSRFCELVGEWAGALKDEWWLDK